jgi:Homeodomain-like domain
MAPPSAAAAARRPFPDKNVPAPAPPRFPTPPDARVARHQQAYEAAAKRGAGADAAEEAEEPTAPRLDLTLPGGFASLAERQELVVELWVKGMTPAEIARTLGISRETARRDIVRHQRELVAEHLPDLEAARARSLTLHRLVQQDCWAIYGSVPPRSPNAVEALKTLLAAEAQICRIEGDFAPDAASAAAIVEVQRTLMDVLEKVGGPELQRAFLAELASHSRTALGTAISSSLEPSAPTVNVGAPAAGDVVDVAPLDHAQEPAAAEATPAPTSKSHSPALNVTSNLVTAQRAERVP